MTNFKPTTSTFRQGSKTLPAKYYTDPKVFEKEKKKIFEKYWFCLGHTGRIPKNGDYFLQEAMGENFIVLRDYEGQIRVHYNVCTHRGTMVCKAEKSEKDSKQSNRKTLQCQYHGWLYAMDGKLINAPSMDEVEGFEKDKVGLKSPPVYVWEGFIFISFVDKPRPFEKVYGPMLERIKDWKVGTLERRHSETYKLLANWKLIFLNFSECYHCAIVHKELSKYISDKSAQNDLSEGPFLGGLMDILNGGQSVTKSGELCALPLGGELTVRTARKGYYYTLLGNLLLNIHPDYLMFHCLYPESAGKTRVESDWLYNPDLGKTPEDKLKQNEPVEIWSGTNEEDWELCELQQKGISSKAYRRGKYSPRESLLVAWDDHYLDVFEGKFKKFWLRLFDFV